MSSVSETKLSSFTQSPPDSVDTDCDLQTTAMCVDKSGIANVCTRGTHACRFYTLFSLSETKQSSFTQLTFPNGYCINWDSDSDDGDNDDKTPGAKCVFAKLVVKRDNNPPRPYFKKVSLRSFRYDCTKLSYLLLGEAPRCTISCKSHSLFILMGALCMFRIAGPCSDL